MATRGWDHERSVRAETTAGEMVDVVTGITRDPRDANRVVAALAIGDGPTTVLRLEGDISNGTAVTDMIRRTLADLMDIERRGGV